MCLERPNVDVFAWEDPAVDRYRQPHLNRHWVAFEFLLDDLRQFAHHELHGRRGSLRIPKPPVANAERGLGGNLHVASQVLGIILGLLRVGERKERTLEPHSLGLLKLLAGSHSWA